MPSGNEKSHSLTHIWNMGFDETNQLPVVELVGVDKNGDVRKVPVNEEGNLLSADPLEGYMFCWADEASPITYVGMENKTADWAVIKIDETSGTEVTYANETNNPTITNLTTARTNRATLTYQLPNLAF